MTVIGPVSGEFSPTHSAFAYTDHCGVTVDCAKARFLRPVALDNQQHASPGARVRFRSNAPVLTIRMGFNGLVQNNNADPVSVIVEGVATDYASTGYPNVFDKTITFGAVDYRNIEVIMPMGGGLDFKGVSQDPAYDFRSCLPRPSGKLLCVGDSMTHGYSCTRYLNSFPARLGAALRMEVLNLGLAGARLTHFGNADWAAALDPDLAVILLGYNDFADQLGQSPFKARYTAILNGLLSGTSAEIAVVTPLWTGTSRATPVSTYRSWIGEVVTAIGNGRISVIDGLALATNSTSHFPDNIHPNDAAADSIAAGLATIL